MPLPRTLCAVPAVPHVRMEIAKAIGRLARREAEGSEKRGEAGTPLRIGEIVAEIVEDILCELRKTGFDPNEPRVPAGHPGGGQWTRDGGGGNATDRRVVSDATPDNTWIPRAQYAANERLASAITKGRHSKSHPGFRPGFLRQGR